MDELIVEVEVVCASLEAVAREDFTPEMYGKIRTSCLLKDLEERPARRLRKVIREEGEPGVVNEELRARLQEWRSARFKADNVPAYTVMHQSTLMEIASLIPKTKAELLAIKGFGKAKYEKYGEEILEITSGY